jgi:DNA-binding IscR family transcriptional regulator
MRGGYVLARKPEDTRFFQIMDAIEGKKPPFDCDASCFASTHELLETEFPERVAAWSLTSPCPAPAVSISSIGLY